MVSNTGRELPSEACRIDDPAFGAPLWRITGDPSINHNLYFLTSSFTPDEKSVIFAGFRDGTANFYAAGFPDGPIRQLTSGPDVNSYSGVISDDERRLFYTRGARVMALELDTLEDTVLAVYSGGKLGEVDVSADGKWLVSAVRLPDGHGIAVTATGGGGGIIHRQARTIIHPQFHPTDPEVIEYAADPAPRMFLIGRDGSDNRCLYEHGNDEFLVHETWLGDTGDLVFTVWPRSLRRFELATGRISTIADFNAWHICPNRDGTRILCDTNCPDLGIQWIEVATGRRTPVCQSRSSNRGSQWPKGRYALKADFEAAARTGSGSVENELSWMEMKTDTVYGPQWTHPHPSLSPSERYAVFTSDVSGHPQVYVVEVP